MSWYTPPQQPIALQDSLLGADHDQHLTHGMFHLLELAHQQLSVETWIHDHSVRRLNQLLHRQWGFIDEKGRVLLSGLGRHFYEQEFPVYGNQS